MEQHNKKVSKQDNIKQSNAKTNKSKESGSKVIAKPNDEKVKSVELTKAKPKLTGSTKFWYIFLCIITLSIFYFYIQHKIKSNLSGSNEDDDQYEIISNVLSENKDHKDESKAKTNYTKPGVDKTTKVKNLKISDKINFNLDDLIINLGGKNNIESTDATFSSLKVIVKDKSKVKQDEIKNLGAKGLIISGQKISILFGDNSITIKNEIAKILNK